MKKLTYAITAFTIVSLTGCATNKNLYNWGSYEPQIYSYFKGDSPEKQINELEAHLAEMNSNGSKPPPGFYAHLAMLYSKVGREAEVKNMFEMEKNIYPESKIFINNIVNGFGVKK